MRTIGAVAALFLVGTVSAGLAAPTCSVDALNALHVADVSVTQAKAVAAAENKPAYCEVHGNIVTRGEGAPNGEAGFRLQLPDNWQQRFFSLGVGGNAGRLVPAANAVDHASALGKGYAVIITDTGHSGNGTDANWVKNADGTRATARIVDFAYRAEHDVTLAGKAFAQAYYAAPVQHAYFDGCSNGGRMAMMEAERYPSDYDGIIAGDPGMDYNSVLLRIAVQKVALASPDAYIPPALLASVDARVNERCDAIDGAKDGLVQNPARCPIRAEDLICHGSGRLDCLNPAQARVLHVYTTAMRDRHGHVLYPGWAITNLSGPRGMSYWTTGDTPPDLAHPELPWGSDPRVPPRGWMFAHEAVTYWLGLGPDAKMLSLDVDPRNNTAGDALVARLQKGLAGGETKNPAKLLAFIAQNRKMIIYHGTSDPAIPAERSVMFYQALAATLHGLRDAQQSVRLFLVPGMQHCSGGIGPDHFDTLSAIEAWVEQAKAPEAIAASTRPDAAEPHNLPLCPYPAQARYAGKGALTDAANWQCAMPARGTAAVKAMRPG